ncbi:MAG: universal stress protein, partial [Casimicrobiaceae bacterium]
QSPATIGARRLCALPRHRVPCIEGRGFGFRGNVGAEWPDPQVIGRPGNLAIVTIVHPVDGSHSALRATQALIAHLDWFRERPAIILAAVHLPVPSLPRMRTVVGKADLERYYDEECETMLKPSRERLTAAGITCDAQTRVGPIAETIVSLATTAGADLIYMGTRGMSALGNVALGSVATRVLHLAQIPVVLIH